MRPRMNGVVSTQRITKWFREDGRGVAIGEGGGGEGGR